MTDLKVNWSNDFLAADLCVIGADLEAEDGLETAVIVSLFTDARVRPDELPEGLTWRRGFWGTAVDDEPRQFGSKLWLLSREKATQATLVRARQYCIDALQWLIQDGVAVAVNVQTFYSAPGVMRVLVDVVMPDTSREEFQFTDVLGNGV